MDNRVLGSLQNKNNCSKFTKNKGKFVIDERASLNEDKCYETNGDKQNNNVNEYMLSNFASCECSLDSVLKTSTDNNGVVIRDGYGISNCNVDGDTGLRVGKVERRFKSDLQLFPRPYLTTPSVARGEFNPNLESRLLNSQQNKKHSQMQTVTEQNIFEPMVGSLKKTVQDPLHIIQEFVTPDWVRGGIPSRDSVKYLDYMLRSSDSDVVKNLLKYKTQWLN